MSDEYPEVKWSVVMITKKAGVCGGSACIQGTRIPVWVLVNYFKLGQTMEQLLEDYPSLKSDDIKSALAYYKNNIEEIEREIEENENCYRFRSLSGRFSMKPPQVYCYTAV
jgi:uncharacterized protein (DUF433 family)